MEGEVGRFRRNRLVPVPEVGSLAQLNEMIDAWDADDDSRRIGSRARTVGQDFAAEAPRLKPLPGDPFETGRMLTPRVDWYSQVTVRCCNSSATGSPATRITSRPPVQVVAEVFRLLNPARLLICHESWPDLQAHWPE